MSNKYLGQLLQWWSICIFFFLRFMHW